MISITEAYKQNIYYPENWKKWEKAPNDILSIFSQIMAQGCVEIDITFQRLFEEAFLSLIRA